MTESQGQYDIVSEFDWELLAFVAQWAHYGGPDPDDVLPNFGMTCTRLRERVEEIIGYARRRPHRVAAERGALVDRAEQWLSTLTEASPFGVTVRPEAVQEDEFGAVGQPTLRRGVWRWQRGDQAAARSSATSSSTDPRRCSSHTLPALHRSS
jgi:hypothetical protein